MAVAVHGADSREYGAVSSITHPHDVGTGSDRFLAVGVGLYNAGPNRTTDTVEYPAPTAMTNKWRVRFGGGTDFENTLWTLPPSSEPASGSNTITVTFNTTIDDGILGAVSFTGVDQTTPVGTEQTATGDSTTASVTGIVSAADELVVDFLYTAWSQATVDGGQTLQWERDHTNGFSTAGMSTKVGAASTSMQWTQQSASSGDDNWSIGGVGVKPAAVAGARPQGPVGHPLVGALGGPI